MCIRDSLKTARGFGDLSENYEYKAAKQELRRCDSRLRYLRKMIDTARVIKADSAADQVGLFDTVDVYSVSYTHLDVYKRQDIVRPWPGPAANTVQLYCVRSDCSASVILSLIHI